MVMAILLAANVVAAGVVLVLGSIAQKYGVESVFAYFLIGGLAVIASVLFIAGAIQYAKRSRLLNDANR